MSPLIKNTLLAFAFFSVLVPCFGQPTSNRIIFLTDYYEAFIDEASANSIKADSIYLEKVHSPICKRYFQKSEYASIVEEFLAPPISNTAELKESIDRIDLNKATIERKIGAALNKSQQYIANDSVTIYVIPVNPNLSQVIEGMSGIMGLTAGSKQIILTIEPGVVGWENMLEYAVAHEFNHAYWTDLNFGKSSKWTLLDYLVFEGRGDYFAHLLYPNAVAPWTMALTESQMSDLWNQIKPNLQSEDVGYQMEVMFGSRNYPVWGGYTLGYDLVRSALASNKNLEVAKWTNLEAVKILEESKYK